MTSRLSTVRPFLAHRPIPNLVYVVAFYYSQRMIWVQISKKFGQPCPQEEVLCVQHLTLAFNLIGSWTVLWPPLIAMVFAEKTHVFITFMRIPNYSSWPWMATNYNHSQIKEMIRLVGSAAQRAIPCKTDNIQGDQKITSCNLDQSKRFAEIIMGTL